MQAHVAPLVALLAIACCDPPAAALQKGKHVREIPSGDIISLSTPKGIVKVKNFFKTAKAVGDALVVMPAGDNYLLDYQRLNGSFLIQLMVLNRPEKAAGARHQAEQQLLRQLGVSEVEACNLDVRVLVPSARLSAEFDTGNYGLSFCPNAKALPGERTPLSLRSTKAASDSNEIWASFWAAFRSAVRKRDRKVLKTMMTDDFEWNLGGEANTPDNAFRHWNSHYWIELDKVLAQGTIPYRTGDPKKRESQVRIAPPSWAARGKTRFGWRASFELGPDIRWRWAGFIKGD